MNKSYRRGQISRIIREQNIHTQEDLAAELEKQSIQVSQVTLSRDLRDMGVVKTAHGYREMDGLDESRDPMGHVYRVIDELLQDVRPAQNLLVLKTGPGNANALAAALDQARWPEVVGTLAGDDTVLVVTPDAESAQELRRRLRGEVVEQ